jgi:hypothetical protein
MAALRGHIDYKQFDGLSLALQTFAGENAPGLSAIVKFELALIAEGFDRHLAIQLAQDAAKDAKAQRYDLICDKAEQLLRMISAEH